MHILCDHFPSLFSTKRGTEVYKVQGISKKWAPHCVERIPAFLHAKGNQNATWLTNFTQPGANLFTASLYSGPRKRFLSQGGSEGEAGGTGEGRLALSRQAGSWFHFHFHFSRETDERAKYGSSSLGTCDMNVGQRLREIAEGGR